eukprot:SAG22_NODE_2481_length_2528_cov_2.864553_3_plen_60_part_00
MNLRDFPFDLDSVPLVFTTMSRWTSNDQSRSGKVPSGKSYRIRKACLSVCLSVCRLKLG